MPNSYDLSNKEDWEIYLTRTEYLNEYISLYNNKRTKSDKAKNIIKILKEHNVSNDEIGIIIDKLNNLSKNETIEIKLNDEINYINKVL